jgi:hypothetical protein
VSALFKIDGEQPQDGAAEQFRPGRLWSLWDLMYPLDARRTFTAVGALVRIKAVVEAIKNPPTGNAHDTMTPSTRMTVEEHMGTLMVALSNVSAPVTLEGCKELQEKLGKDKKFTYEDLMVSCEELHKRLMIELSANVFLSLDSEMIKYFKPAYPLFGDEFANRFATDGAFELDEAAKCLALKRPTAAVFHLMRVMEIGIRSLAKCLSVPDPIKPAERNWGIILNHIRDGIEKKWPTSADRATGDGPLFEELCASLDAVKNPWRNSTMHVKKYTDDEAEHIFIAVKEFMEKLASRCDENGLPLA